MGRKKRRSISLKQPREISLMREAGRIVAIVLNTLEDAIRPGVTTWDLDVIAEGVTAKLGGIPAFKGYQGFPASICASVNEELVHGIPSASRVLKEGDIVTIDFGASYQGYFGDSAVTLMVGTVSEPARRLLQVTEESLAGAIGQAHAGKHVSDLSKTVQTHVEANGFSVVRQYVGHGIGVRMHEEPPIPNYFDADRAIDPMLQPGMVLAIEPMVNQGSSETTVLDDEWTVVTSDRMLSAHFEHSVAITENGPEILTRL
jgi:methionyl aminopeptidase